jgi:hypothetical protein
MKYMSCLPDVQHVKPLRGELDDIAGVALLCGNNPFQRIPVSCERITPSDLRVDRAIRRETTVIQEIEVIHPSR